MKKCRMYRGLLKTVLSLAICSFALVPKSASANEETFPTLQVGTHVYTNVTVTTKAKRYIFIQHSTGMENIKVGDLTEEIRTQLGYVPEVTKSQKARDWAKGKLSDIKIGDAAAMKDPKKWQEQSAVVVDKARALDRKLCGAILGTTLLVYLCFAACCMLICRKAGSSPGILVWLPFLQVIPMMRAARMSLVWLLFLPLTFGAVAAGPVVSQAWAPFCVLISGLSFVVLIIGRIVWCFKIADARGKSFLTGLFLLLPLTSWLAFLYLALSDSVPEPSAPKEDSRTAHLMTLETA